MLNFLTLQKTSSKGSGETVRMRMGGSRGGQGIRTTIAPDKAAYCVFTQFRERENSIKFISVRAKTQ